MHKRIFLMLLFAAVFGCITASAQVTINEIMYDSFSSTDEEWVELYNTTGSAIDVSGWCLCDDDSFPTVSGEGYIKIPASTTIPAYGYLVISEAAVSEIDCEVVCAQTGSFGLGNSGDSLSLWTTDDGTGTLVDGSLTGPIHPDLSTPGSSIEASPEGLGWAATTWYLSTNATGGTEHINHTACGQNVDYGSATATPEPPTPTPLPPSDLVINEFQADPDAANGDANGDGTVNTSEDEFVEIINTGSSAIDITDWTIREDSGATRHTFPSGSVVEPGCGIVVFGGGTPTGMFGGCVVQTATVGYLGLGNTGDDIRLHDDLGTLVVQVSYGSEGGQNQSLTRDPDLTGSFVLHSVATGSGGSLFSPGTYIDGTFFSGCSADTPTPTPIVDTPTPTSTPEIVEIVINELLYDTPGTDAGCFVELLGPPGTNLTGWTIAGVNGSGGGDYNVVSLDGQFIPGDGYFVVAQDMTVANYDMISTLVDFQNGPDSVQLRAGAVVVDAVGYGSFGGTDIFAGEGNPAVDPFDGSTLSRIPNGSDTNDNSVDFTYGNNTSGLPNTAPATATPTPIVDTPTPTAIVDTPTPIPPTDLVLNEFLADPSVTLGDANGDSIINTSDDEFVEIINTSVAPIDISGYTLNDGFGLRHTFPAGTVLQANCGIVVFGGGTPTGTFGNCLAQVASSGALGLNNTGDTITLYDDTAAMVLTYTYGAEGGNDESLTRDPDLTGAFVLHSTATGSGGALFSPGTQIDGTPFGGCFAVTPTETPNPTSTPTGGVPTATATETPGPTWTPTPEPTQAPCDVNVLANPDFEFWTAGDLDEWIPENGLAVVQNTTDFHAGISSADLTRSTSADDLNSPYYPVTGGGIYEASIWVIDNDATANARAYILYYSTPGSYISSSAYGESAGQDPGWQQLDIGSHTAPATANYMRFRIRLTDVGTVTVDDAVYVNPCGAASPTPTATPTGAPAYTIYDLQYTTDPSGDSPHANEVVQTTGIVTGAEAGEPNVFIQDGPGAWNGLLLWMPGHTLNRGDSVTVQGLCVEYNNVTEISPVNNVIVNSTGNAEPATTLMDTGETALEQYESVLMRCEYVEVSNEDLGFGQWGIDDGTGQLMVDDTYTYTYTPTLGEQLDFVQGPLPYTYGDFKLFPRDDLDIQVATGATPTPRPVPVTGPVGVGVLLAIISGLMVLGILRRK